MLENYWMVIAIAAFVISFISLGISYSLHLRRAHQLANQLANEDVL